MMQFTTEFSLAGSRGRCQGMNWLLVIGLFMVVGIGAQRLARETSRGLQYLGLGLAVVHVVVPDPADDLGR